jgi:signal transduction histidine kinase
MRRGATVAVAAGVALLLGSYVYYTQRVVAALRLEASRQSRMYAQVFHALGDTSEQAAQSALLDLAEHIRESGVPMILTDASGRPESWDNLDVEPLDGDSLVRNDDPRLYNWVIKLDEQNPPVVEEGVGTVHFGHTTLVQGLRIVPIVQAILLGTFLLAGIYTLRVRERARREQVWAGMARESAHQLGTPLSSLGGWLELLEDRETDDLTRRAVEHMRADLERLERVAHRFERIGRPPLRTGVELSDVVERVAAYFRARVPTLAHTVTIKTTIQDEPLQVQGDSVLLEWALEALVKNSIDALAGRGGTVTVEARRLPEGAVCLRVIDSGPGVPRELRRRIFDAGFSTKPQGWGIGLALTRRIVTESHGGTIALLPTDRGANFEIIFPA